MQVSSLRIKKNNLNQYLVLPYYLMLLIFLRFYVENIYGLSSLFFMYDNFNNLIYTCLKILR